MLRARAGSRKSPTVRESLSSAAPIASLALVSQVLSAGSSLSLPLMGMEVADLYAVASQSGHAALTGIAISIVYNLAIGRPGYRQWGRWGVIAGGFSLAVVSGQYLLVSKQGGLDLDRWVPLLVFVLFGLGGAFLAQAGIVGVQLACVGMPRYMAGVTVLPNLALLVGVLFVGAFCPKAQVGSVLPAGVWMLACACTWVVYLRAVQTRSSVWTEAVGVSQRSLKIHTLALGLGAIASTVVPAIAIATASSLGAGVPFLLALIVKFGNSFVSLGVNSFLLARYSWEGGRLEAHRGIEIAAFVCVLASFAGIWMGTEGHAALVVYGAVWLVAISCGAIVSRDLNVRADGKTILAKVLLDVTASMFAVAALSRWPSLSGYFGCFVVSAGVTLAVGGFSARRWGLFVCGMLVALSAFALVVTRGLTGSAA